MVEAETADAAQETATKVAITHADTEIVAPETNDAEDEQPSASESEESEDDPVQDHMCAGPFRGRVSKKLR